MVDSLVETRAEESGEAFSRAIDGICRVTDDAMRRDEAAAAGVPDTTL
jgi:hypothetical protein